MIMEELFTQLLDLPPLEVVEAEVLPDRITLHCRSVLVESICPSCLKKCNFVKDTHTRKLRDLPISGKRVTIRFTSRQFVCRDCNRHFYEQYGLAAKNGTMTQRYEDFIRAEQLLPLPGQRPAPCVGAGRYLLDKSERHF